MLSLMLAPWGLDNISLHFPGEWCLGITPKGLECTFSANMGSRRPMILPSVCSSLIYSGFQNADTRLIHNACLTWLLHWKPIWKPLEIPSKRYFASCWSGWSCSLQNAHLSMINGDSTFPILSGASHGAMHWSSCRRCWVYGYDMEPIYEGLTSHWLPGHAWTKKLNLWPYL